MLKRKTGEKAKNRKTASFSCHQQPQHRQKVAYQVMVSHEKPLKTHVIILLTQLNPEREK